MMMAGSKEMNGGLVTSFRAKFIALIGSAVLLSLLIENNILNVKLKLKNTKYHL